MAGVSSPPPLNAVIGGHSFVTEHSNFITRILTKSGRAPPQPVTLTFDVMTPKTIGVLLI